MSDDEPYPAIPIAPSMREYAAHFPVETIVAVVRSLVAASRCYTADDAPDMLIDELADANSLDCLPEALANEVHDELSRIARFN